MLLCHPCRRGHVALGMLAIASVLATTARACVNDGTTNPCCCLAKLLVTAGPGAVPTLSGSVSRADSALAAAVSDIHVGSTYYTSDTSPLGDLTINVGDTIHWIWDGGLHTVTTVPNAPEFFDSGLLAQGQTFDHTFMQPGTYVYYCQLHSFLNGNVAGGPQVGTITVIAVPEPTGTLLLLLGFLGSMAHRRRTPRR